MIYRERGAVGTSADSPTNKENTLSVVFGLLLSILLVAICSYFKFISLFILLPSLSFF